MKPPVIFLLSSLLLTACTTGGIMQSESIPVGNKHYAATYHVDVYFGSYNGDKKYEQISYLQIKGGERSKTGELMKELRRKAKIVGADAIINVKKGSSVEKDIDGALLLLNIAGGFKDSSKDSSKASREYRADTLEGIAIKYLD